MAVIKKIKILKNKVTVFIEGGEKLELDKNVFPNFYLYVGKDISNKEMKKIETANNASALLNYALKLRQKSSYSEFKMREKLYNKEASKEQVDNVIKTLKDHGLIDDKQYIEDHVEYYNSLNYGKNKIVRKLKENGIFEEKIEKVNFPSSIERKKANNILPKLEKKYEKLNSTQKKKHIYDAYLSQGFEMDLAREMCEKIKQTSSKEENKKLESDFDKAYRRYKSKYSKKEIKSKLINYLASKGYKISDIINMMERKHI